MEDLMSDGAKVWYFPDGYLPEKSSDGAMEAHEAMMFLNTSLEDIEVLVDIYFSEASPVKDIKVSVTKESVKTIRLDHPDEIGGLVIPPLVQYALRVRSPIPIVVQFGRLDTTQNNMAYYGSMGYFENN